MDYVYGAVAIAAFSMLTVAIVRSYSAKDFDLTSFAVAAAVILPNLTTTIAVFTGGRNIGADVNFNRVVTYQGLSIQANNVASPILVMIFVGILIASARKTTSWRWASVLYTVLILLAALASFTFSPGAQLTLAIVAASSAILKGGQSAAFGAGAAIALLAALSALSGFLEPDAAYIPCDTRKCGIGGSLYSGIADNHNSFGLLMALGVPFVYLGLRAWSRSLTAIVVFLALLSGDRTAQVAAVVTYAALLIAYRADGRYRIPNILKMTAVFGVGTVAVIPFIGLADSSLTGRPYYWRLAIERFASEPILGYGTDGWRSLVRSGVIPLQAGYSTHNEFTEALFLTGLVGALLLLAIVVAIIWQASDRVKLALVALPIIICSITERPWSIDRIDWMSWSFLALVLFVVPLGKTRTADATLAFERRDLDSKLQANHGKLATENQRTGM